MQKIIDQLLVKAEKRRKRRKAVATILTALGIMVAGVVTWELIVPGIAMTGSAFCGKTEHAHTDECGVTELTCTLTESEGHIHGPECYETRQTLVCGMEEGQEIGTEEVTAEDGTVTTQPILHQHTEECYTTEEVLICGQEESEGHKHTAECYTRTGCEIVEHQHSKSCYSNPKADLETQETWEATLPKEEEMTGIWAEDLITVAKSQLGYKESAENYEVVMKGEKELLKGITRYGQWYGVPYGDWCAMYVSFCLHYTGIPEEYVPYEAGCDNWVKKLTELEMYTDDEEYIPVIGDLIFFNWDKEPDSDHVGIVTDYDHETKTVYTIEGNAGSTVKEKKYDIDDDNIMGYGILPEKPLDFQGEINFTGAVENELETEANPNEFVYEDKEMTVTATLSEEAELPEDAEFDVNKIEDEATQAEVDELINQYATENGFSILERVTYDMGFISEGEEVEPNGMVAVNVAYQKALEMQGDLQEGEEIKILHIAETEEGKVVEDVTQEVVVNDDSNVEEADFEVESFSTVTIAKTNLTNSNYDNNGKLIGLQKGNDVTVESILGEAVNYGLVANHLQLTGHMDTTFAVKLLESSDKDVTAAKYTTSPDDKTNAGWFWIGEMHGKFGFNTGSYDSGNGNFVNKKATAYVGPSAEGQWVGNRYESLSTSSGQWKDQLEQYGDIVVKSKYEIDEYVDGLMNYVHNQSDTMATASENKTYTPIPPNSQSRDNYYANGTHALDLTALPDGTYYIDGDYFFGSTANTSSGSVTFTDTINGLKIKLNKNQTIVFNFSSEAVYLKNFKVVYSGVEYDSATSDQSMEKVATHVIFNMPNCKYLGQNGGVAGTFIAPHAEYHIGSTSTGWIVVNYLNGNDGEWHYVYQNLPKDIDKSELVLTAEKTVSGEKPSDEENGRFSFELRCIQPSTFSFVSQVNNVGEKITFDKITFNSPEEYVFKVTENIGTYNYKYDTTQYYVKVHINNSNKIESVKYYKNGQNVSDQIDSGITFNNINLDNLKVKLEATKMIKENNTLRAPKEKESETFSFKLVGVEKLNSVDEKTGTIFREIIDTNNPGYITPQIKCNSKEKIVFDAVECGADGTFYYRVTEEIPADENKVSGMTYDNKALYYQVIVDKQQGTVTTTFVDYKGDPLTSQLNFENNYEKPTDLTVNKKWIDPNTTDITSKRKGSIDFELYQVKTPAEMVDTVEIKVQSTIWHMVENSRNGWYWTAYDPYFFNSDEWGGDNLYYYNPLSLGTKVVPKGSTVRVSFKFNRYSDWNNRGRTISLNGQEQSNPYYRTWKHNCSDSTDENHTKSNTNSDYRSNYCKGAGHSFTFVAGQGQDPKVDIVDIIDYDGWWGAYDVKIEIVDSQGNVIEPPKESTTLLGKYTLSQNNNWEWTAKTDFPSGLLTEVTEGDYKYNYTYYIKETVEQGEDYNLSGYFNNSGIDVGTITAVNQTTTIPEYDLPETGGSGTRIFTIGGAALAVVVLLYESVLRQRKRERRASK